MTKGPHTMTKDELLELADRCEREEASWGLTCEIEAALNPGARILVSTAHPNLPFLRMEKGQGHREWRPPPYTTSLDAAVTLVPEQGSWEVSASGCATVTVLCGRFLVSDDIERHATGRTPALALCAAALRARASCTEPPLKVRA